MFNQSGRRCESLLQMSPSPVTGPSKGDGGSEGRVRLYSSSRPLKRFQLTLNSGTDDSLPQDIIHNSNPSLRNRGTEICIEHDPYFMCQNQVINIVIVVAKCSFKKKIYRTEKILKPVKNIRAFIQINLFMCVRIKITYM